MTQDKTDFITICEVTSLIVFPIFWIIPMKDWAFSLEITPFGQFLIFIILLNALLKISPQIGGILAVIILMIEDNNS